MFLGAALLGVSYFFFLPVSWCRSHAAGLIGMERYSRLTVPLAPVRLFWHQALRQLVGAPATYLTYSVLKLKRSTLVSRYLGILLTFAVSGLYHVGEEYASGLPVERSGAMRFYCTQVFGFVIEDAATALYSRVRREKKAGCWAKVIGFIWTLCWMSWTSPSWFYPKLVANTGTSKDQALPG